MRCKSYVNKVDLEIKQKSENSFCIKIEIFKEVDILHKKIYIGPQRLVTS